MHVGDCWLLCACLHSASSREHSQPWTCTLLLLETSQQAVPCRGIAVSQSSCGDLELCGACVVCAQPIWCAVKRSSVSKRLQDELLCCGQGHGNAAVACYVA
jgi:hypothetical protein